MTTETTNDLAANATQAERLAFERLTRERTAEIKVHCYRMVGSLAEAEDLTQETFVRAWRARAELSDPAAARAWLYRIATNACLDQLRRHKRERRLWEDPAPLPDGAELGAPDLDTDWLEPMPHSAFAEQAIDRQSPAAIYEQAEALRLAFLACVQLLPPRQRGVFLLHEVRGWSAAEIASAFEISPQAANSQLQRARRTFDAAYRLEPKWAAASDLDQQMAERYASALENRDLDALASLLHPDAKLHMPPWREWVRGTAAICAFFAMIWKKRPHGFRSHVIRANGRCAVANYACADDGDSWQPHSIVVLEVRDGAVASIVAFLGPVGGALFSRAGLPLVPKSTP